MGGSLSKANRLARICGDSGQGSSLRMMYLIRSASLRNIILRLRKLAPEAAILPVVLNVKQPRSIGACASDGAAIATSEHGFAGGTSLLMYGGVAEPNLHS